MKYRSADHRDLAILMSILLLSGFFFAWTRIARSQAKDEELSARAGSRLITVNTSKQGNPHINFDDPLELKLGQNALGTQPVALVSADFDSDGIADIVTADASGSVQLLKGIDQTSYAIDPKAEVQAGLEPFTAIATGASLGISPDYLFAGDFNADGKQDLLGAAKGVSGFVVVIGDGLGHFSQPVNIAVGGVISAVESGEIGKPDGQADLAVTYSNKNGSFLAVYEHPESAFKHAPEIIKLPSAATTIAIGNTDEDFYSDITVGCGNDLVIVHERGQAYPWDIVKDSGIVRPPAVVKVRSMPFTIASIALGRFGEKRGTSLAILGGDGNIYHLEAPTTTILPGVKLASTMSSELKADPFEPADSKGRKMAMISQEPKEVGEIDPYGNPTKSASERKDPTQMLADAVANQQAPIFDPEEVKRRNAEDAPRREAMKQRSKRAFIRSISAKTTSLAKWNIKQLATGNRFVTMATAGAKLTRANLSDSSLDDLIVTSESTGHLELVIRPSDASGKSTVEYSSVDGNGGILAILPIRLNLDGISDLVVLRQATSSPEVIMSAPRATFSVNTTADEADCNFGGFCSLRDAIRRANQIGGPSTIYFDLPTSPAVIAPLTPLPAILRPVTIQGSHFPNGTKKIEISGENMGGAVDGLKVRTSNAFIYDLAITGFKSQTISGSQVGGNGIAIESDSALPNNANNTVLACFLGIDVTGATAKGNMAAGVLIFDSDNNDVTNTVSSGNNTGIAIEGGNSNSFNGNILGLNAVGTAKVANFQGMFLAGADNRVGGDFAGAPNTISGNGVVSNIAPCVGYGIVVPIFVDLTTLDLLSHDNSIVGNKLGTDPSGGIGLGNCWQGINAEPLTGTTIGSIAESGRNIISGNGLGGVWCEAVGNANQTEGGFCSIMGNNVGTDITGSYSIYNDARNTPQISGPQSAVLAGTNYSVSAIGAPGGTAQGGACTGFCNLVSGNSNGGSGIDLASGIMVGGPGIAGVFNNYVGTKRNGSQVLVNAGSGIDMASTNLTTASPVYFAGGHTEFDGSLGNLVSGNDHAGIVVGATVEGSPGEYQVQGNLIGTDLFGELALPNGSGVFIGTGFINTVDIGDSDPLGRNVIAGNAFNGINLFSGFGVKIVNNAIGVNGSLAPLGNGGTGVNVGGYYASSIIVGGTDSTTSNIISNNGKSGVKVNGVTSTFTPIRGNVIQNNGQLGIDLNQSGYFPDGDGVTLNDDCAKDADLGANRLQNYPVLFSPGYNVDGTVHVTGTLISEPFSHFRIDVYATLVADPSGHGEGQLFLGTAEVTVDGNGFGSIDWNSLGTAPNGAYISATATDDLGNTSEFSCNAGQSCDGSQAFQNLEEYRSAAPLTCPASIVVNIDTDQPDVTGDQVCDVNTSNGTLDCSLRAALELVNNPLYVGPHEITFNIPGSGVHTISPATPLPEISKQVQILGDTQPGSETRPMIELNGSSQDDTTGLVFALGSDDSRLRGLIINRFPGTGVIFRSNRNTMENCWIGLLASGVATDPAGLQRQGVEVLGSGNIIGSTQDHDANFIAGNSQTNIRLFNSANDTSIFGNFIGLFADRLTFLTGPFVNVLAEQGASNNTIGGLHGSPGKRNVIVGGRVGIELIDGANGNKVLTNIITSSLFGILITRSSGNFIGTPGTDSEVRNVIYENVIGIQMSEETPVFTLPPSAYRSKEEAVTAYRKWLEAQTNERPTGIQIYTHDNSISNNLIGPPQGSNATGNAIGIILVTARKNYIGLGTGRGGNFIYASLHSGVEVGYEASENSFRSNVVGLNPFDGEPDPNIDGFDVRGDKNTFRGNTISGNSRHGLVFTAEPTGNMRTPDENTLTQNIIGTNPAGDSQIGNGSYGVWIEGNKNKVGLPSQGNVISGNGAYGIKLSFNSSEATVTSNMIGVDSGGVNAIGNSEGGISISGSDSIISDNTISGNGEKAAGSNIVAATGDGIEIDSYTGPLYAAANKIEKNRIGTSSDGMSPIPNLGSGVAIRALTGNACSDFPARRNVIGGLGLGNVISGNGQHGVELVCPKVFQTIVQGNKIGTDITGTSAMPNGRAGIFLSGATLSEIGGSGATASSARNIISGNTTHGIQLQDGASLNKVTGNYIGVGANGTLPLGNGGDGIYMASNATGNTIGGPDENAGNIIANNGRNGVGLTGDAGSNNNIDPNLIFANAMRGITLNEASANDAIGEPAPEPVPNDQFDFDTGANKLQNYPDIATYNVNSGGDLIVSYRVDSSPGNSNYGFSEGIRVEFFKPDATGQGEKFLNSDQFKFEDFTASGNKTVNLGNAALMGFIVGDRMTATATDFEGNTSEFSPVLPLTAASVTISGRVLASLDGRGVRGARIALNDGRGNVRSVTSGVNGVYRFDEVEPGRTYIVSVASRRFNFAPQVVQITDNIVDLNFFPEP